ncbi:hypothetical protein OVA24_21185 [Luteolibacter sp. SL250]|uniref:hypothetical protein n=1 Tax=Luteolibacter sp. SL250 TaxID=2995170 RepID=UPI00226FD738|nr:hypothetical protein [Luteolibacter sp. SL250]WAC19736.1 hypothetical protein OVA24_21185 [Luteolibacter sp. SL250]
MKKSIPLILAALIGIGAYLAGRNSSTQAANGEEREDVSDIKGAGRPGGIERRTMTEQRRSPRPSGSNRQGTAPASDTIITPAEAGKALARLRLEEKNLETLAAKTRETIALLCKAGYSREAWELIDGEPGMVREASLQGFFHDAALPKAELMQLLDGLEKKDRAMGLSGYWNRLAPEEFSRLDLSEFAIRSPDERAALRQTFQRMTANAYDPGHPELGKGVRQDLLNLAAAQVNSGVLVYEDVGKMLKQDPSKDGFAYWDALSRVDPTFRQGQDSLKGTDAEVIRAMTIQDPERTLDMTLVMGTPARGKGYVALEKWLTMDFRAAETWYHRNSNQTDADSSAVAFMRACRALGRYQEALDWYARIEKESWRTGVGGEMRAIERKRQADAGN